MLSTAAKRVTKPKLALTIPLVVSASSTGNSPFATVPRTPISAVTTPMSPTTRNTRFNQQGVGRVQQQQQQLTSTYSVGGDTKGILKRGQSNSAAKPSLASNNGADASRHSACKRTRFNDQTVVHIFTPVSTEDGHVGAQGRVSRSEARWVGYSNS